MKNKTVKKELELEKKRVLYYDILKIMACFLVIINHSGLTLFTYTGYNKLSVLFYSIGFSICKMGVAIFLMVTGALLLNRKDYNIKDSLKSIFRVFIPLIAISLYLYLKNNKFSFYFIPSFFEGPLMVLYWYIYMLIGLYLIYPFLNKMLKNLKLNELRNLIIICLLIPGLILIFKVFFNINISNYFTQSFFSFPIMYSIAGLYLSKIELNKKNRNIAYITLLIPLVVFIIYMYITFLKEGKISYSLDNISMITTSLPALSIFYLIRYYNEKKEFKKLSVKILSCLSSVTFGIYLFHPFTLYIINMAIEPIVKYNPYIGIILIQIICFLLCGLVTYILKKIPVIKKFL